ncbi:hypothetical protein F1C76_15055 [Geodermatophilaceae bacterium NBWT11]|nr:hypothetical protein F1C76_15055 [Geodermatophilaceae bacterium NBWT11]
MNAWQPLMPRLYFRWIDDIFFTLVFLGMFIFSAIREDWVWLAMAVLWLGSIVAQARYAAVRIQRGGKA